MKGGFISYFTQAPKISAGKRALLIILGILLFLSLVSFGPILALHQTVFNPDCIASYVDDIDVPALAHNWLKANVAPNNPVLAKTAELIAVNFEPQIKEQLRSFVHNTHAYILDRLQKGTLLQAVAEQRTVIVDLATNIQSVMNIPILGPVFDSLGFGADSIQKYINVDQINSFFNMLEQLDAAKSAVSAVMISFIPLIILILALIIAIKLIARRPEFISGELGLIFIIAGALQFVFILPAGSLGRSAISQFNLPALIHDWLLRMVGDFSNIMMIYGGALLFCGIVLIVLYYVFRPRAVGTKTA